MSERILIRPMVEGLLACGMAVMLATGIAAAADGQIDRSFGTQGRTVTSFGTGSGAEGISSLMLADKGGIVAGGPAAGNGLGLTVYRRDGSLDPSFGGGLGVKTQAMAGPSPYSAGYQYVRSQDGKIVAVGFGSSGSDPQVGLVARFLPTGLLDPTFGFDFPNPTADGVTIISGVPNSVLGTGVALGPVGSVFVAGWFGTNMTGGSNTGRTAKLNADGSSDLGFGGGSGYVPVSSGTDNRTYSVAVQPNGRILMAGTIDGTPYVDRAMPDGTPDTSFGSGGTETLTGFTMSEEPGMRLFLQPDGRMLLGGTADLSGDATVAVMRLTGSGQLDGSFASGGVASQKVGDSFRFGDLAVQDDGRVVVVGVTQTLSQRRAVIMRLLPNGTLDSSFGGGVKIDEIGTSQTEAYAVAVQPDRRILVGEGTYDGFESDRVLTRLLGDTVRPKVRITRGPKGPAGHVRKVRFRFRSNELGKIRYRCKLAGPGRSIKRKRCHSPFRGNLHHRSGSFRFKVVAIDPAGNVSRPVRRRFKIAP